MVVNIKGKDRELKFTFNSFKYMENFDVKELEEVENKPFKLIPLIEMLLMGALNNDPTDKVSVVDVEIFLEDFIEEGSVSDLLNELMELLQDSNFFKSLQKNQ